MLTPDNKAVPRICGIQPFVLMAFVRVCHKFLHGDTVPLDTVRVLVLVLVRTRMLHHVMSERGIYLVMEKVVMLMHLKVRIFNPCLVYYLR